MANVFFLIGATRSSTIAAGVMFPRHLGAFGAIFTGGGRSYGMDSGPRAADRSAARRRRVSSAGMARLQRHVQAYVDAGKFPGAISMVQRRGKVVHFQTYSQRDLEADTPVERDTIFRIYSMTKPIVSIGLMTLYEEGRCQLDDPVSQYIPSL